jgi:serine/threonine protein kinase
MDSLRPNAEDLRIVPGTLIANYVVEELLGQGTEGSVYVARDSLLGRQVALKTLRIAEVGETRGVEEARLLAALEHPNVVRVLHARRHQGIWFVVFEYLAGGSLQNVLDRNGAMACEQALDLLSQAAAGLAYVHEHGILHRDLKPHNLLLSRRGELKLCDFGLALDLRSQRRPQSLVVGTPAFLAPELWQGSTATTASDVFSLGVCLFQMLTCRLPFLGTNREQLKQAHAEIAAKLPPGTPPPVAELVEAMLAKDPAQRPTSKELPKLLGELGRAPYRYPPRKKPTDTASLAALFSAGGPSHALREVFRSGRDRVYASELIERLTRGESLELSSTNSADGCVLLDVAMQGGGRWQLLARLTLIKTQVSLCEVIEQKLGLASSGTLAEACEHLVDPARRSGSEAVVVLHAPRGLTREQRDEVKFVVQTLEPHQVRCVLITPVGESPSAEDEASGLKRLIVFEPQEDTSELEQRLELWLRETTGGKFSFSFDGKQLLAELCSESGRFWGTLALQSLFVASAAGMRVVTSWAVQRACDQPVLWHDPSEVPAALRKRPLNWPPWLAGSQSALEDDAPSKSRSAPSIASQSVRPNSDSVAV